MEKNTEEFIEALLKRSEILKNKRSNFESRWQEICELVMPRKANFTAKRQPGALNNQYQYDTTASYCADLLASSLHGFLTNPASNWFNLRFDSLPDELKDNSELRDWLAENTETMRTEFNRPSACFSTNIHETYIDLVTLGTAALYVGWNDKEDSLLFQSRYMGEIYVDENAAGQVDTIFREFSWNLRKIIEKWGRDCLPEDLKDNAHNPAYLEKEFTILHAIFPNHVYNRDKMQLPSNRPVSSVFILKEPKHLIAKDGYFEQALFVPRWLKVSDEIYGRSQAMSCLPDIKMLQEMMKETLTAAQLANYPTTLIKDDDEFFPTMIKPHGFIKYRNTPPQPYNANVQPRIGIDFMNEIRGRIRTAFFIDIMMTSEGMNMTATEVMERVQEKMRALGPILGRLQSELLGPMITRGFGLLQRRGKLKPLPDITLKDGRQFVDLNVSIEYLSPLAMAQKQITAQNMAQAVEMSTPFFNLNPGSTVKVDCDKAIDKIFKVFGVDDVITAAEEIEAIREAQKQAASEQTEKEDALLATQIAANAKGLKNV